jgi:hypothetical protein
MAQISVRGACGFVLVDYPEVIQEIDQNRVYFRVAVTRQRSQIGYAQLIV